MRLAVRPPLLRLLGLALIGLALLGGPGAAQGQDDRGSPPSNIGQTCLACHTTFDKGLEKPRVHTPAKASGCTGCHKPHTLGLALLGVAGGAPGQDGRSSPPSNIGEACLACHTTFDKVRAKPQLHTPAKASGCTGCHKPHTLGLALLRRPRVAQAQGARSSPPPNIGEICLTCHTAFDKVLEKPHVHPPVKARDCIGCHNPHTAKNPGLVPEAGSALCFRCHRKEQKAFEKAFVHAPVREGQCQRCHLPHSSDFPKGLAAEGVSLCQPCHKAVKTFLGRANVHPAIDLIGCQGCHDPHASDNPFQLKSKKICLECHPASPRLRTVHYRYPVDKADCGLCHDPHSSEGKKLFRANLHQPFASRQCKLCHNPPDSPEPFKTVKEPLDLCLRCHPKITDELKKTNLHLPGGKRACVACHNPHNSSNERLLVNRVPVLCWKCHTDTVRQYREVTSKHQPNEAGECLTCHRPHGADEALLLSQAPIALCGTCHEGMTHATHPMEEAKDPRTNLPINCLTCHNPHGTPFDKLLYLSHERALCVQCHKEQL